MTDPNLDFELRKVKRDYKTKSLLTPIHHRGYSSTYFLNNSQPYILNDQRKNSERVEPTFDLVKSPEMSEVVAETQRIKRDAEAALRWAKTQAEDIPRRPTTLSSSYFPELTYYTTNTKFQHRK